MGDDDLGRTANFKTSAKHRIIQTFRKWDENGDGVISEDELSRVLVGLGMDEKSVGVIWAKMDKNNDGGVAYIEFVEWLFGTAARDLPEDADQQLWAQDALNKVIKEATTGDGETAATILRQDRLVSVQSVDEDGTTILMAAAKGGQLDLMRQILDMGFEGFNATDKTGNTALDYAISTGRHNVIEYMTTQRTAGDNTTTPFIRSLFPAVMRGDVEAVSAAVLPRVEYSIYIDRHLNEYLSLDLLPCGGTSLLVKKVDRGLVDNWNERNIKLKVQPGDHIIKVNETSGDARTLQTELGKYQEMHITLHRYWPELGFNPNECDERGTSMLHHAVRSNKFPMVKALFASDKVEENVKDRHGRTALDIAEEKDNKEIIDLLKLHSAKRGDDIVDKR